MKAEGSSCRNLSTIVFQQFLGVEDASELPAGVFKYMIPIKFIKSVGFTPLYFKT